MKRWLALLRVVRIQEYYIEADTVEEARRKALEFDSEPGTILETPDWEVVSLRELENE
jgi:hypothetical protein